MTGDEGVESWCALRGVYRCISGPLREGGDPEGRVLMKGVGPMKMMIRIRKDVFR